MMKTCKRTLACLMAVMMLLLSFTAVTALADGAITTNITINNMGSGTGGWRLVVSKDSLEAAGLTPFIANTFAGWTISFHVDYTGDKEGALTSFDVTNAVIGTSEVRGDGGATLCIPLANLSAATGGVLTADNFSTVMDANDAGWAKTKASNVVLTNINPNISLGLPENTIVLTTKQDFQNYITADGRGAWKKITYNPQGQIFYTNTSVTNSDAIAWTKAPATGEYGVFVLKGDVDDTNSGRNFVVTVGDTSFTAGKRHYDDPDTPVFGSGITFAWLKVGTVNLTAGQEVPVILKGTGGYARAAAVMLQPVPASGITVTEPTASDAPYYVTRLTDLGNDLVEATVYYRGDSTVNAGQVAFKYDPAKLTPVYYEEEETKITAIESEDDVADMYAGYSGGRSGYTVNLLTSLPDPANSRDGAAYTDLTTGACYVTWMRAPTSRADIGGSDAECQLFSMKFQVNDGVSTAALATAITNAALSELNHPAYPTDTSAAETVAGGKISVTENTMNQLYVPIAVSGGSYVLPETTEAVLMQASIQTHQNVSAQTKSVAVSVRDASKTETFSETIPVTAGLAKAYRLVDTTGSEPTVLDALIAAHVQKIGDDFIQHPSNYLTYDKTKGRITMAFGGNGLYYRVNGGNLQYGDPATTSIASASSVRFEAITKFNFEPVTVTSAAGFGSSTYLRIVINPSAFPFPTNTADALTGVKLKGTIQGNGAAKISKAPGQDGSAGENGDHLWDLNDLGIEIVSIEDRTSTIVVQIPSDRTNDLVMGVGDGGYGFTGDASCYTWNLVFEPAETAPELAEGENFYFIQATDFARNNGSYTIVTDNYNAALYSTENDMFSIPILNGSMTKAHGSDPTIRSGSGNNGYPYDASVLVNIPAADTYYIWALVNNRGGDNHGYTSYLTVNGVKSNNYFGDCSDGTFKGFKWELVGAFNLKAGENKISLGKTNTGFNRVAGLMLTTYDIVTEQPATVATDGDYGTYMIHGAGYISDACADFIQYTRYYPASLLLRMDMDAPVVYEGSVYVRLKNMTNAAITPKCVIAFYDANDNLVSVQTANDTAAAFTAAAKSNGYNYGETIANDVIVSAPVPTAWAYGKVMLWDGFTGLKPYCASNTFANE